MHIESCLEYIAYIEKCHTCLCAWWLCALVKLGNYVHWWNLLINILGEIWWICEDVKVYLLYYCRPLIRMSVYRLCFMTLWDFVTQVVEFEIYISVMYDDYMRHGYLGGVFCWCWDIMILFRYDILKILLCMLW